MIGHLGGNGQLPEMAFISEPEVPLIVVLHSATSLVPTLPQPVDHRTEWGASPQQLEDRHRTEAPGTHRSDSACRHAPRPRWSSARPAILLPYSDGRTPSARWRAAVRPAAAMPMWYGNAPDASRRRYQQPFRLIPIAPPLGLFLPRSTDVTSPLSPGSWMLFIVGITAIRPTSESAGTIGWGSVQLHWNH